MPKARSSQSTGSASPRKPRDVYLGTDDDACAKPWKTDLAAQTLARFTVIPHNGDIDALIRSGKRSALSAPPNMLYDQMS